MEMQKALNDTGNGAGRCEDAIVSERNEKRSPLLMKISAVFQENSIPAVRKFARSVTAGNRLFWATVFLGTLAGFIVHLVSITVRFNETPVSTETRVAKVDRIASVLICPQNYLNDVRVRRMKDKPNQQMVNMTFDEIYNDILPMFWNLIYTLRDSTIDRQMVGLKIKSNFKWYLSNVWQEQVEHEKQDVFLHMYMLDKQLSLQNITKSFDSTRNRCFAWNASGASTQSLISILNVPDGRYFYAEQDAQELVSDSGLWLYVCFNEAFGCHDSIRYFLRTGFYTKIDLRKTVVSQLGVSGEGDCIQDEKFYNLKEEIFDSGSGSVRVPYTSSLCNDINLQHTIYEQCGCLSVLLPTEMQLYSRAADSNGNRKQQFCNLPPDEVFTHRGFPSQCFTSNPPDNTTCTVTPLAAAAAAAIPVSSLLAAEATREFLKRDTCHDHIFHNRHRTFGSCPKLCRRQQFSSVHSIVPWPQSQLSRNYPDTFARIFVNTIEPYITRAVRHLSNSSLDGTVLQTVNRTFQEMVHVNFSKKVSYNKGMDYLTQRLLLLEIGYASADMQVMSEIEAYPLKSFLSDIGGIMGLWIGMAIVSICELLLITTRALLFIATRCVAVLVRPR